MAAKKTQRKKQSNKKKKVVKHCCLKPNARQVYKQLPAIKYLVNAKNGKIRKEILKSPDIVSAVSSVLRNASLGKLPIKGRLLREKLHKLKSKDFDKLASPSSSVALKRKILLSKKGQRGDRFLSLLAPLLPIATNFLSNIFGGKLEDST